MPTDKFSNETPELRAELQTLRPLAGLAPQRPAPPPDAGPVSFVLSAGDAPGPHPDLFNERQIHTWDLVDVSYLERGATVARAVGKLHARDAQGPYVGTGFLVSDRLLVTSSHNLPTPEIAASAFIEFEHELGPDARPRDPQRFVLQPGDAYWTNTELDICLVAVAPVSQGNMPLSRYGRLRLNPAVGKIDVGQFISIVHHPDGEWKQVALRENRLLKKDDTVLWYASDTLPGSSGAPCFSDQWQVVGVHRRGVPATKEGDVNLVALRNGQYMTRQQIQDLHILDRDIVWLANEGTRISVFIDAVSKEDAAAHNPLIRAWLADVGPHHFGQRSAPQSAPQSANPRIPAQLAGFDENRRPLHDYEKRNGYQPDFLGMEIPPPAFDRAVQMWGSAAYNSDTGKPEFPYYNFSLWMCRERRLPFVSAVNIDGATHDIRDRSEFGDDKWEYDDRLPERMQIGNWFYGNEPAAYGRNYFDRGHIVRRVEPSWGPTDAARLANDDTFHWTNCSPQYKSFNQRSGYWQGLETYLLEDGAIHHALRMTIFSGPIFSNEDTLHRGVLVPKQFFKVAVFLDKACNLRSAAYVLDQSQWVDVIDFERARKLNIPTVRRSICWLEQRTGLDFGEQVRRADPAADLGDDLAAVTALPDLFG